MSATRPAASASQGFCDRARQLGAPCEWQAGTCSEASGGRSFCGGNKNATDCVAPTHKPTDGYGIPGCFWDRHACLNKCPSMSTSNWPDCIFNRTILNATTNGSGIVVPQPQPVNVSAPNASTTDDSGSYSYRNTSTDQYQLGNGTTRTKATVVTGLCTGNTNTSEDVACPPGFFSKPNATGVLTSSTTKLAPCTRSHSYLPLASLQSEESACLSA